MNEITASIVINIKMSEELFLCKLQKIAFILSHGRKSFLMAAIERKINYEIFSLLFAASSKIVSTFSMILQLCAFEVNFKRVEVEEF